MEVSGLDRWSAFALSALMVFGQWSFWTQGVYSLGFNTTFIWLLVFAFFCKTCEIEIQRSWSWLTPLCLIAISYSLFENPWLNVVNLGVLPVAAWLLFSNSHFVNHADYYWNGHSMALFVERVFRPILFVDKAITAPLEQPLRTENFSRSSLLSRSFIGILILLPLAIVVLVLLATVDASFERLVLDSVEWLFQQTNWIVLLKMVLTLIGGVVLLVCVLAWKSPAMYEPEISQRTIDDLIAGIVLGGILIIYVLFLSLQVNRLVVGQLPLDYGRAEHLVKSGFWQLCFISVINVLCFLVFYRTTGKSIQLLLGFFVAASGLLMVSAAWRMALYVFTFGLSYEKFFASYTVVFALGIFTYLLFIGCLRRRRNVGRFLMFSALWAYALTTVSPIEKTIFYTNLHFSQYTSSRILPIQLSQLSLDILDSVKINMIPSLENKMDYLKQQDLVLWQDWIEKQEFDRCARPWYQTNMSLILYCPG